MLQGLPSKKHYTKSNVDLASHGGGVRAKLCGSGVVATGASAVKVPFSIMMINDDDDRDKEVLGKCHYKST